MEGFMINMDEADFRNFEIIYDYLNEKDILPDEADAIVVGGAGPRLDMAERAAEIFHQGITDIIIFSGFKHPDFTDNEAEILISRAIELGVPKENIIAEPFASNTAENIIFSAKELKKMGRPLHKIILVHRPFMTRRFKATAEAQWPGSKPSFYVTSVEDSLGSYLQREESDEMRRGSLKAVLGDYERITSYAKKGWQTVQPKSQFAEEAYRKLIIEGYESRISQPVKGSDINEEALSFFIHDMWAKWYLHMKNNFQNEQFSKENIWDGQANTRYDELTEADKEKDRKFAREIIKIVKGES